VAYVEEHNEDLPEDYPQKSKMWKGYLEGVWDIEIEILAAAKC